MNAKTWRIAKAILRGKKNNDYEVLINNTQVSLQDYLAYDHYTNSVLLPEISNTPISISKLFNKINSSGISTYLLRPSQLHSFVENLKKDKKLLEEQEKDQIITEFKKYTFSDKPELRDTYFAALGAANYINKYINKTSSTMNKNDNKDKNIKIIKKNSEHLEQLINDLIRINPESINKKYDEQTFREAINSRKTMLKNKKIYNNKYNKEKIFMTSIFLLKTLGDLGYTLRQEQKKTYPLSPQTMEYLSKNEYLLMF